jgi:hypothetical protein
VKLFFVLVVLVIFAGPTVAKRFTTQPEPTKRGVVYRTIRRFGLVRVVLATALVVVLFPTVGFLLLR